MNALFELLGNTITQEVYDELVKHDSLVGFTVVPKKPKRGNFIKYMIIPEYNSEYCIGWAEQIKFAKVSLVDYYGEDCCEAILRSTRSKEDEIEFLHQLSKIEYDNGYGSQELYGIIVFKDGSWLERREYDGSEWWAKCELPLEEEYFK